MILMMGISLAACGGAPSAAQGEEASQAADSGQENGEAGQESVSSFPVPTQGDPAVMSSGINMTHLVTEGCTEVINDGGVFLYKMSSQPTGETLVNFINETLIPEIVAISDNGACLVRDSSGNDALGLGAGVQPYRAFDSFGYTSLDGEEYAYWIVDGEQFGNERHLYGDSMLLDVRYVYDGVLYDAITRVRPDEQAISVTPFEEPSQNFEIIA